MKRGRKGKSGDEFLVLRLPLPTLQNLRLELKNFEASEKVSHTISHDHVYVHVHIQCTQLYVNSYVGYMYMYVYSIQCAYTGCIPLQKRDGYFNLAKVISVAE